MDLDKRGPDTWIGSSANYPMPRVYGGQVIAQGLWAAAQTVDAEFAPHSLHAYFIRPGMTTEPIRYEVDRLRSGRSFAVRAVVARQSSGAILQMSCSFQKPEIDAEVQTARMPLSPDPEDLPEVLSNWPPIMNRRFLDSYPGAGRSMGWTRIQEDLGDNPLLHLAGLAFTSDSVQFRAARSIHPLPIPVERHNDYFMGASLDHAIWFHRQARADEWHLYEWDCHGLRGARGMTVGNVFTADGTHVASIAQEVLLRERKPPPLS